MTTSPINPEAVVASIKLLISSRLANIRLLGLAVHAFCVYLNFDETEAYQVQLAVVEAVTNVIKHAYNGQPGREVKVTVTLNLRCLSFQVVDTGRPLPAFNQKAMEFDPADVSNLPEGGMGLVIIHHVMDRVEYRRVGESNILTMDKYLPPEKPPS